MRNFFIDQSSYLVDGIEKHPIIMVGPRDDGATLEYRLSQQ